MTDFAAIRKEFPILDQEIHGHPLVYLDSAATSQKPQCVIDAESDFYRTINAGVHRGAHELAARSTMTFRCEAGRRNRRIQGRTPLRAIAVPGACRAYRSDIEMVRSGQ